MLLYGVNNAEFSELQMARLQIYTAYVKNRPVIPLRTNYIKPEDLPKPPRAAALRRLCSLLT